MSFVAKAILRTLDTDYVEVWKGCVRIQYVTEKRKKRNNILYLHISDKYRNSGIRKRVASEKIP